MADAADTPPASRAKGLSASKAARLVGNTGPRPTAAPVPPTTSVEPRTPVPPATPALPDDVDGPGPDGIWSDEEISRLHETWGEFVRRRISGDYAVDDFGFDPEFTDRVLLALMRPLYRSWFRVEVTGALSKKSSQAN